MGRGRITGLLILSLTIAAHAQSLPDISDPAALNGGTSVTANLGGTMFTPAAYDSGNALFMIAYSFVTPAAMTSPSFGSCGVAWRSPTANDWGCAIYSDSSGSPGVLLCSAFSSAAPTAGGYT